jgi:hypothetical protein
MVGRDSLSPHAAASFFRRQRRGIAVVLVSLVVVGAAIYVARRSMLLLVARTALDHDSELVAQERANGVAIVFARPPPAWIDPMKNRMNDIWDPIRANGVNYFLFAGPRTWLNSYSERSNPASPYYQAWVGGYVIKLRDSSLPPDLEALAWQVTALDQRSWLSAMGDPSPIADPSPATNAGNITIDGHSLPLWHGTMHSHSDLSARPMGPLATLIGMPAKASWPVGVDSFHDVTLDGYFACWVDAKRKVSIVVYAVAASYAGQGAEHDRGLINDELLSLMKSVGLEAVH